MVPAAPRAIPTGRVALLFSDIQGSTALLNRLGDRYADVLDDHDRIVREALAEHGGYEFSNEGDSFGAAFPDPVAAADAALAVQRGMAAATWPGGEQVRVRIGLHHGEPKVRGHDYWGEDVHFAARICGAAHGGQVILSAAMRATVPTDQAISLGHHGLKDFPTPRELFQLVSSGARPEPFPAPRTLSAVRSNLPSITTPVIGREDVLAELAGLFADGQRLVTLTGAGGMGKTRVAIELGERLAERYADGVAFVALAAVDSTGVAAAVGDATGAPRGGDVEVGVLDHLKHRRMLVILDNCEHLVEAAAALATSILDHCPHVVLLATAQLPLDLSAETVHRLPPLITGAAMFVERAHARDRSFRPSESELGQIEELCDLLEGFPLAIELASARVRLLGTERLLDALRRDLGALGAGGRDLPQRHRTLQAALAWTLSLLTSTEREVFTALGAFAVSWSLEEAEQLLAADLADVEAWDALTRLMDASLVVVRGDGRFAMAQRVRQHAAELLASTPTGDRYRGRHAELVGLELRDLALEMYVDYRRMLANVVDLLPEARHALAWSRAQDRQTHRHVVGLMAFGLSKAGHLAAAADDIESFPEPGEPANYDDAATCFAHGLLHAMRWSTETDVEAGLFDRAARGFEACGELREAAMGYFMSMSALTVGGRIDAADDRFREMVRLSDLMEDPRWRAEAARDATVGANPDPQPYLLDLVAETHGVGAGSFGIQYPNMRSQAAVVSGNLAEAAHWAARSLREHPRDALYLMLNQIKSLSWILALQSEDSRSAELRAAVNQIYRSRTGSDHGDLDARWTEAFAASEARLSHDELTQITQEAAELSYDDLVDRAVAYADRFSSAGVDERA